VSVPSSSAPGVAPHSCSKGDRTSRARRESSLDSLRVGTRAPPPASEAPAPAGTAAVEGSWGFRRQWDVVGSVRLSPETIEVLVGAAAEGKSRAAMAEAADVSSRTLQRWLRAGEGELQSASLPGRLVLELERARAKAVRLGPLGEADLIAILESRAREGHVRAVEVLLARKTQARPARRKGSKIDELAERRGRRA
jgi:hypothetical protein